MADPRSVLDFWFAGAADDAVAAAARESFWFEGSPEVDARVRERFAPAVEAAARGELDAWRDAPRPALALVLLLDQFPRNLWRGTAGAFQHDARALAVARDALARGHLGRLTPVEQAFLILPLQHSEALEDQRESVRLATAIAERAGAAWQPFFSNYVRFAELHLELVERFGRFPHRNRALGRASTAEEEAHLGEGGERFGEEARPEGEAG